MHNAMIFIGSKSQTASHIDCASACLYGLAQLGWPVSAVLLGH